MKPELRSLIPKLNRYLLLLLVFICSLSVFLLLYPISSKSPQSDLDNKATLPGVRNPDSDPNDETQSDTTETAFSGYIITLDAGHGGYDPGKIGINDSKEKDINLQIASYLQELLDSLGFEVYMTRTDDSSLNTETAKSLKTSDLNHRIEIVASHNSDFFISIHQNSFSDSSVHGAQVFYYANSSDGEQLAKSIQASIHAILDSDNERPVKGNLDYLILKKSPCPAVIVECGFLSNPDECSSLNTPDYQKQVAAAIADGLVNHIQAGTE